MSVYNRRKETDINLLCENGAFQFVDWLVPISAEIRSRLVGAQLRLCAIFLPGLCPTRGGLVGICMCLPPHHKIQNTQIQNTKYTILYPEDIPSRICGLVVIFGPSMCLLPHRKIQNTKHKIQDTNRKYKIEKHKRKIQNVTL